MVVLGAGPQGFWPQLKFLIPNGLKYTKLACPSITLSVGATLSLEELMVELAWTCLSRFTVFFVYDVMLRMLTHIKWHYRHLQLRSGD